ncbi:MAG TPA: glycosyltransferase [Chitinophagaceae bacterium]|nr:glycosyltransferase [Chitinophagaceae bacterium]
MYKLFIIKRIIENVFIFPFILIGRLIAAFQPPKKEYRIFFFFPFYHTGGAEKVHAQIAKATGGNDCIIFFTRRSDDDRFIDDFKETGCEIKDISAYTDNKWLYFFNLIYRGIITGYINRQKLKPIVFNGQCNFAYKISPWINNTVKQIELIHSLNSFSYIRIPFIPFIDKTVMISRQRIADHKKLYQRYQIPLNYAERIVYICNGIPLPSSVKPERSFSPFTVLYSGRPGPEKRIHLITAMAKELQGVDNDIQFEMIGDLSGVIDSSAFPFIKFHGNINDPEEINSIYSRAHLLLITSSTEGFPMVIMEAMANGCAIMATRVGDVPFHVKDGENGFLFSSVENESAIIKEACEKINWLRKNPVEWKWISGTNIRYAVEYFGIEQFNSAYRDLLK